MGVLFRSAAVASFLVLATGAAGAGDALTNANAAALGDPAPAFTAHSLQTGRPVTNADFNGKVLVVNFWATWCPPCRAETPDMVRAYKALNAPDVAFLGIDTTEVPSVIKTFLSAKGVPYPIALGGPDAYNGFGVSYIPTTVVIDAHGTIRARWTGELAPERLAQFVADARAGKNYALDTPDQTIVGRLLDPATYHYDGDAAAVTAEIARAKANAALADDFAATHGDGKDPTVDFTSVQALEGAVLLSAGQAAAKIATTDEQHVAADKLLAGADGKLNRYADAVAALQDARTREPSDASLLLAIAKADYRLHDYDAGIDAAKAYTAAKPEDADGWDFVGLSYQRSGKFADAAPAYEKAVALMRAEVPAAKTAADRVDAVASVADESLDLANVYVALGDVAGTERAFATANEFGNQLDPKGKYANLYRNVHERTQEGLIAVRLAHGDGKTALSVAPWTGPDLPGSIPSTIKYRLIVASRPNAKVDLQAQGLRPGWVASFCGNGLCSPNRVSLTLPESGVTTYEFQLVPPGTSRASGHITIRSGDGTTATVS